MKIFTQLAPRPILLDRPVPPLKSENFHSIGPRRIMLEWFKYIYKKSEIFTQLAPRPILLEWPAPPLKLVQSGNSMS